MDALLVKFTLINWEDFGMKGGVREGAGRPKKIAEEKTRYVVKSIKFKENEQYILDYIENCEGKNFSDKLKKILIQKIEKK